MSAQLEALRDYAASAMDAEWLTFDEACEYLRLSRQSIYRLINSGTLTQYRIPGLRGSLFKKKDLDELPAPTPAGDGGKAVAAKTSRSTPKTKSKRT